jgi:hypothetical protein
MDHTGTGVHGDTASNPSLLAPRRWLRVDTRQPWMERATPTHFILERTVPMRKVETRARVASMSKRGGEETGEKMGARHARGERRREGGPINRQGAWSAEAGGGSVTLSRKAKAGEMRSEGVRYGVGRNGPVALAGLKE